ncbi:MAG: hypothetical protein JRH20_27605, partial [Deltaproteobacteria bacterium]|nr:hypothetical protein [Deltaproteobacteria bacterium]
MKTQIKVWQSFSSNNSSDYRLVARFGDAKSAKAAVKELQAFITAHAKEVDETGDIDNPSQAQQDLAAKYNFDIANHPLCWGDEALVDDEPHVAVAETTLLMYHSYCGGLEYGFGDFLRAVGANTVEEASAPPTIAVWFTLPSGAKGKKAQEALEAFFAQRESNAYLSDWPMDPPWMAAGDLPYADPEEALWFSDGEQAAFSLPMNLRDLDDLEAWLKKNRIKDYRLLLCDGVVERKLQLLSKVKRCPECQAENPKYLAAESESLEEDQLLCDACGGMFSLASIETLAEADTRLNVWLEKKGMARQCPHCKGSDLALRGGGKRIESQRLLCMGCKEQVTVRQMVGTSPVRHIAEGVLLNNLAVRGDRVLVGARDGSIYLSTDGGDAFKRVKKGRLQVFGLTWVSDDIALAAGYNGVILRSDDGGRRFSSVTSSAK